MFLTAKKKIVLKINEKYLKNVLFDRLIFQLQGIKRIFCKLTEYDKRFHLLFFVIFDFWILS